MLFAARDETGVSVTEAPLALSQKKILELAPVVPKYAVTVFPAENVTVLKAVAPQAALLARFVKGSPVTFKFPVPPPVIAAASTM